MLFSNSTITHFTLLKRKKWLFRLQEGQIVKREFFQEYETTSNFIYCRHNEKYKGRKNDEDTVFDKYKTPYRRQSSKNTQVGIGYADYLVKSLKRQWKNIIQACRCARDDDELYNKSLSK